MRRLVMVLGVLIGLLVPAASASALTCSTNIGGDWNTASTWSCGGNPLVPTASDTVIINGGTVTISSAATASSVNVQFTGALTFTSSSTLTAPVTIPNSSASASINVGGTVNGIIAGNVTNFSGQVNITGTGTLGLQANTYTQSGGKITVADGATLSGTNTATVSGGDVLLVAGGDFYMPLTLSAGQLSGIGNLASLNNTGGDIRPGGLDIGTIGVNSGFTQSGGSLIMDVAGSGAGEFDKLTVGDTATLGGALQVIQTLGLVSAGQTFPIVTAGGGVSGIFGAPSGLGDLTLAYLPNQVNLVGPPPTIPSNPPITPVVPNPTITLPSNKKCQSKRSFKITQNPPSGTTLTSAKITLNGKAVKAKSNGKGGFTATINLKGLKKGKAKVKITVTTAQGKSATTTRTYKTCTKKKKK